MAFDRSDDLVIALQESTRLFAGGRFDLIASVDGDVVAANRVTQVADIFVRYPKALAALMAEQFPPVHKAAHRRIRMPRELTRRLFRKLADSLPQVHGPFVYHAVYSPSAALEYGSGIWLGEDGREVEATCVDADRDNLYAIYGWRDKVYVGRVTKRLRQGMPDTTSWMSPSLYRPKS